MSIILFNIFFAIPILFLIIVSLLNSFEEKGNPFAAKILNSKLLSKFLKFFSEHTFSVFTSYIIICFVIIFATALFEIFCVAGPINNQIKNKLQSDIIVETTPNSKIELLDLDSNHKPGSNVYVAFNCKPETWYELYLKNIDGKFILKTEGEESDEDGIVSFSFDIPQDLQSNDYYIYIHGSDTTVSYFNFSIK